MQYIQLSIVKFRRVEVQNIRVQTVMSPIPPISKKKRKRKENDLSPQTIEDKQIMTYLSSLPYLLRICLSGLTTLDQIFSTSHLHFYDPTIKNI